MTKRRQDPADGPGADMVPAPVGQQLVVAFKFRDGTVMTVPQDNVIETMKRHVKAVAVMEANAGRKAELNAAAARSKEERRAAALAAVRAAFLDLQPTQRGRGATTVIAKRIGKSVDVVKPLLDVVRNDMKSG